MRFLILGLLGLTFATGSSFAQTKETASSSQERLNQLLKDSSFPTRTLSPEIVQVTVEKDGWKVHILVSMSQDNERVWLEAKFSPIAEPDKVPAERWREILETNEKIGPAHFAFSKSDQRLHLYRCFDLRPITPEIFRKEILAFDAIVRSTYPVWRGDRFQGDRELINVVPKEVIEPQEVLQHLQGAWKIVRIEVRGKVATEEMLEEKGPRLTFDGDSALLTGGDADRTVKVRLQPAVDAIPIDFIDEKGRVEKGICKKDADQITLCFSSPGNDRPAQFVANEESGSWILVLRRIKP